MNSSVDPDALQSLHKAGGRVLIEKMIGLFLENTPLRLETLQTGIRAGDWEVVERTAHSMKSSAATLGLTLLRAVAAQTEALAQEGRHGEIQPLVPDLTRVFLAARTDLLQAARSGFGA